MGELTEVRNYSCSYYGNNLEIDFYGKIHPKLIRKKKDYLKFKGEGKELEIRNVVLSGIEILADPTELVVFLNKFQDVYVRIFFHNNVLEIFAFKGEMSLILQLLNQINFWEKMSLFEMWYVFGGKVILKVFLGKLENKFDPRVLKLFLKDLYPERVYGIYFDGKYRLRLGTTTIEFDNHVILSIIEKSSTSEEFLKLLNIFGYKIEILPE